MAQLLHDCRKSLGYFFPLLLSTNATKLRAWQTNTLIDLSSALL